MAEPNSSAELFGFGRTLVIRNKEAVAPLTKDFKNACQAQ